MIANEKLFLTPNWQCTYLRARGFQKDGARVGGIIRPKLVILPAVVIFRLFEPASPLGDWWFTAYEMKQVVKYFCREPGDAFGEGRAEGKGILQAVFAVRHDWGGKSPDHMGKFIIAQLLEPLFAYVGESDDASCNKSKFEQKAVRIVDDSGTQRRVRQLFIPDLKTYQHVLRNLGAYATDTHLIGEVEKHALGPLYFEG